MIEFVLSLLLWGIVGAVAGFYGAYFKKHDPRLGVMAGAGIGFLVGVVGFELLNIINTPSAAAVTIIGVVAIGALLIPIGTYTERVSHKARIASLAYALILPTLLIVLGIVVFPVMWNLLFSFREIDTGELREVNLFDVSNPTIQNYEDKLGLTLATVECVTDFDAALIVYDETFDPEDGTQNFIAMDTGLRSDTGFPEFSEQTVRNRFTPLEAGEDYVLVIAARTPEQTVGFNVSFDGPGGAVIDGDTVTTYSGTTGDTFNIPSGTGRNLTDDIVEYHAQPFTVDESGDYIIRAEPSEIACERDEDGDIVYASLNDSGVPGYTQLSALTIGGERYVLGARDAEFYNVLVRTVFYTLISTILAIGLGLVAAIIVRDAFPGRGVFRGFLLFPYIAPVISVAFVWDVLLRQNGPINAMFGGDRALLQSGSGDFLGLPIPLIMAILFQAWRYFPFAFLFLLARIQAIPDDLYEAAKVDGAAPSQRLLYVTLPQLRAVFGTLFLLRFIWTFNKFDDIYLLTGPIDETRVITIEIFQALFTASDIGQASAIAVVMAIILAIVMLIYFRFFFAEEE
jgi:ABC-type sugar transport system permease subunit